MGSFDFLKAGSDFSEERPGQVPGSGEDDDAGGEPVQPTAGVQPAPTPSAEPAAVTPAAPAATPAQPAAAPAATPAVAPAAVAAPQAAPAPTPAAAPAAPAQPAVAAQPAAPAQPEQDYATWRGNAIKTLAEGPFALSEETAAALQDDPAKVLPNLAANIYLMAIENGMAAVRELLPQVVPGMMEQRSAMTRAVESFNTAAPDLAPHMDRVTPISTFLRSQFPDMPTEQFIPKVIETARQVLGLQAPQASAAPVAPAAPAARPLPPHTPVVAQAPRPAAAPVQGTTTWADLAGERGVASGQDEDD